MRRAVRVSAALLAACVIASMAGCARADAEVVPELWQQVDAAQASVYEALSDPEDALSGPAEVFEQLSMVAEVWDGVTAPAALAEDAGVAVVYNLQERAGGDRAAFDVFVASGVDEHFSVPGLLDSRPHRVYTCYGVEVSFALGDVRDIRRQTQYEDGQFACPSVLVRALGDGTQFREPDVFDG